MNWLEAKIAFRSFRSVKSSSFISFTIWITLCGVSVGVMALIVVMSVMNGFESELQENIIDTESHILLYRKHRGIDDWRRLKADIEHADPRITRVLPITFNEVLFVHKGRVKGGILEGVDASSASLIGALRGKSLMGGQCAMGEELALRLNVRPGETIKVLLPNSAEASSPQVIELSVAHLFSSGLFEYSSRYVYADLSYVQKKLGWMDRVAAFKVGLSQPEAAMEVARKVRAQISFPFFVRTWMHLNQNIFLAIKIEKSVMAIILGCIIFVAVFNVMSGLIMIVIQKTKEISILKAIGMRQARIQRIFVLQGLLIGGIGAVVGAALALIVCALLSHFRFIQLSPEIYFLSHLPVKISGWEVCVVMGGVMAVSIVASFFPARRAARLFPVEGIRYE